MRTPNPWLRFLVVPLVWVAMAAGACSDAVGNPSLDIAESSPAADVARSFHERQLLRYTRGTSNAIQYATAREFDALGLADCARTLAGLPPEQSLCHGATPGTCDYVHCQAEILHCWASRMVEFATVTTEPIEIGPIAGTQTACFPLYPFGACPLGSTCGTPSGSGTGTCVVATGSPSGDVKIGPQSAIVRAGLLETTARATFLVEGFYRDMQNAFEAPAAGDVCTAALLNASWGPAGHQRTKALSLATTLIETMDTAAEAAEASATLYADTAAT